eukprot:TRINITY_DN10385_c0_g1_i2.p2 TRINITY_DN10385_c0_g1~~TRINITY_DN10385_c0_g1_i2.p2  ORF type:complete len:203 (+),score=73.04 TRINITY_DN10385_c0_g1_i2:45-611(+)
MVARVLLLLACLLAACSAFVSVSAPRTAAVLRASNNDLAAAENDSMINKISVAVTNSPFNQFKKFIAKAGTGEYDEAEVAGKINSYIADNKVMVFSWTNCPFCKKAKAQLAELMEPSQYKVVELDQDAELGKAYRFELSKITGRTSVPQIWIKGEFIGGCNDGPGLLTLQKQDKLVPMLKKAGCKVKA